MQVSEGIGSASHAAPLALTIGVFDGIHRGHQHVLATVVARARQLGLDAAALTFEPHPAQIVRPEHAPLLLTTLDERIPLLAAQGLDLLVIEPFTAALSRLRAAAFMERVCDALPLRELWIGWDFVLGHDREGTPAVLRQLGARLGFSVHIIERLATDGPRLSSTAARHALLEGDIDTATTILGRPYHLAGRVVSGDRRGSTIGVPTANLALPAGRLVPANGVYVCRAQVAGAWRPAVTNIGVRPTFDGLRRTVEAHLLEFDGDLYDQPLTLQILARLRAEQRFASVAELVAQIRRDVVAAQAWFAAHP
ncbi:MAG: bifunctional riboflavin kinase/FAD synthetase [Chloroflexi bacterium]|nr:bifunctional riboflavin kinase/FAD synthetase [Chloroflexota bacterium]